MRIRGETTCWLAWVVLGPVTIGGVVTEHTSADAPGSRPTGVHGRLQAVPFDNVRVDDPFWSPRIQTIQDVTIPDLLAIAEEQGKIDNVRLLAGRKKTGRIRMYNSPDSDLWKIMEAGSYTLAWRRNAKLEAKLDELIALYAAAQAADGYINSMFMLPDDHPNSPVNAAKARLGYGSDQRFKGTIEQWPYGIGQLYCAGHLFESAAAHHRATGKRTFLDVATKMADCVYRRFPPGKPIDYADHPQAGLGLIKLYQVTGNRKYLALADHIVHHGHHARPPDLGDRESWKPLVQQRKAYGHAVRIHYLYSAATDLCRYLGQPKTRQALESLWHSVVDRRIYVIAGVGGPAHAEQLAEDYVLDNARCYCECCANIAHGQWNHRLNLLTGQAHHADLVELVAYNGGLSGISLDGAKYFYTNVLAAGTRGRKGPHGGVRTRYLFCCPSKLPGLVAGIGRWVYACDDRGVHVNLYVGGSARVNLGGASPRRSGFALGAGKVVEIAQTTRYPWDGEVKVTLTPAEPAAFDVCLRIPGWVRGKGPFPSDLYRFGPAKPRAWQVRVNGKPVTATALDRGYLRLTRTWRKGDTVELSLPMPVRRVYARKEVRHDRGRVALMRGPVVYCVEAADNPGLSVSHLVLPAEAALSAEHRADLLGGVTVIRGKGLAGGKTPADFTAVPYYAWQNRGVGQMAVWLIENPDQALRAVGVGPLDGGDPTNLLTRGTVTASTPMVSRNTLKGARDGRTPKRSGDKSQP